MAATIAAMAAAIPVKESQVPDDTVMDCNIHELYYGNFKAVRDVALKLKKGTITAFIGPSGCGKSTVLRCLNRLNDLVPGFRLNGRIFFRAENIYAPESDVVMVRRNIGMVFQQPNPFTMSIFRNVAFGLQLNHYKGSVEAKVEEALKRAALWDEVKDKLRSSGLALSGGQQQRLCIARAIATNPALLLMDEPCSGLDPIATRRIEELMLELKKKYTIVIVTHHLDQAKRIADMTAFLYVDTSQGGRTGYLVEYGPTIELFENPRETHTQEYLKGKFG
jgi:phosphate transport system ATP-binding protein